MFAILCLVLASTFLSAQNSFLQPLNGPNGTQSVVNLSTGPSSGQLFVVMDRKVYRSADNGDTWSLSHTGLNDVYGERFFLSPSGEFYLYLKYLEHAYHYNPATDSWKLLTFPFGYYVKGFNIDSLGRMWVCPDGYQSNIYYSTDEGQTFQQVMLDNQVSGWEKTLACFNDAHNLLVVNEQVYHFNMGGVVQQAGLNTGYDPNYLGYNPNTGTAFCSNSNFFKRSTDGGFTWQSITLVPGQSPQPEVKDLHFEGGAKIWAYTAVGVFWSENDGDTWTKDAILSNTPGAHYRANNGDWFVSNACAYPNFARSGDGGITWTDLSMQFQVPTVSDIQKDAAGNLYAKTCRWQAYEKSNDEGQTWDDLTITDGDDTIRVVSLAIRPDGVMMAFGDNKRFYRSLNNGTDWSKMTNLIPTPGSSLIRDKFYVTYNGVFYLFQQQKYVRKSTDNGDNWQEIDHYYFSGNPVFHPNGDFYYTHFSESYHYHFDEDWTSEFDLQINGNDARVAHCSPDSTIFLYANSDLYRLLNGSDVPQLLQAGSTISRITSNSESDLFGVNNHSIIKSENGGLTWNSMGYLPNHDAPITLYVATDQYLYAGFAGKVIYRSASPTTASIYSPSFNASANSVIAYPNPFDHSIIFEVKGPALPGNTTLRLFDALGRQVRREEFAGEKFVIQRQELETGLYYFLIESGGKQIGVGKVVAK